jgi:endonuclease III
MSIDAKTSSHIIRKLRAHYGKVAPALAYTNLYQITIAVVLSAQTTDRQVNGITPVLFKKYPDFRFLAQARTADVEKIIHSTGFYHAKARNIISLSRKVMDDFDGVLPETHEELVTLPGVGRKSANVILSQGYGVPAMAVDTHVGRVARRIGYTTETNPDLVEKSLTSIIPCKDWTEAHLLFITHGRTICGARNPLCGVCPVAGDCAYEKGRASS